MRNAAFARLCFQDVGNKFLINSKILCAPARFVGKYLEARMGQQRLEDRPVLCLGPRRQLKKR
jgi:hypothetical protein